MDTSLKFTVLHCEGGRQRRGLRGAVIEKKACVEHHSLELSRHKAGGRGSEAPVQRSHKMSSNRLAHILRLHNAPENQARLRDMRSFQRVRSWP